MACARHVLLVLAGVVAAAPARGQTLVYSGAGARASPGGGSRSVLFLGGEYVVFFDDGSGVVYTSTPDGGASFAPPEPASGAPANQGFSVARKDATTLGLVWGSSDAAGYQLWYREAAISGSTLTFAAPTLVASSASEVRGFLPSLLYSAAGSPFIAAIEYNRLYVPGTEGGCGPAARYRMVHYRFDGAAWQWQSYCNDFSTALEPSSTALARSGGNMIASHLILSELATKIVNEATELGEPWNMAPSVSNTVSGQLSSVQGWTTLTDVHHAYPDGAGTIGYGRQDGTNTSLSANLLDLTAIGAGTFPALSRPTAAAGCYTISYVSGTSIRRRRFSGSIASLGPETTLYATPGAATNLSAELDAAAAPALVWQVGGDVYFGVTDSGTPPAIAALPASAPADGASIVAVSGGGFTDSCGAAVVAGTPLTVASSLGTIVDADVDGGTPGTQVAAGAGGTVAFTVRAPATAGSAVVSATVASGGPAAAVTVTFTAPDGGPCLVDGDCASGHCSPAFDDPSISYCTGMACGACFGGNPAGMCVPSVAGTACVGPGGMCSMGDACDGLGACAPGAPVVCDDLDPCTTDTCDPATGCVFTPAGCPDAGPDDAGATTDGAASDGSALDGSATPDGGAATDGSGTDGSGTDGAPGWQDYGVAGGACGCRAGYAAGGRTGAAALALALLGLLVARLGLDRHAKRDRLR